MHNFYCPGISDNKIVQLPEQEMHHALHVLRLKNGDHIRLLDGEGSVYESEIISLHKKEALVQINTVQKQHRSHDIYIHLAIAPVKSADRLDFLLEKITEIGVDEITPLRCQHSGRKTFHAEKERQTIVSAMKQSGNAFMPVLNEYIDIQTFLNSAPPEYKQKYIAHCGKGKRSDLAKIIDPQTNILLLIGPEGDFSEEEILLAEKNNFTSVTLGTGRLRTETAAIAALQIIHTILVLHKNEIF